MPKINNCWFEKYLYFDLISTNYQISTKLIKNVYSSRYEQGNKAFTHNCTGKTECLQRLDNYQIEENL